MADNKVEISTDMFGHFRVKFFDRENQVFKTYRTLAETQGPIYDWMVNNVIPDIRKDMR